MIKAGGPLKLEFGSSEVFGYLDKVMPFEGWIASRKEIKAVYLVHGNELHQLNYGHKRPDVRKTYQNQISDECGFSLDSVNILTLPEGRNYIIVELEDASRICSCDLQPEDLDAFYLDPEAEISPDISHTHWLDTLSRQFNKPGMEILEVGARHLTCRGLESFFNKANYTGCDIAPGEAISIVSDAHCLSANTDRKYDLIYSSAVFEHLAMPWLAAREIIKCLKVGGYVFIETHYSWSSHERPWHFFQFSEKALEALFPPVWGMEKLQSSVSTPMIARYSHVAPKYLADQPPFGRLYCHSEYFAKKVADVEEMNWDNKTLQSVYAGSFYPQRQERR